MRALWIALLLLLPLSPGEEFPPGGQPFPPEPAGTSCVPCQVFKLPSPTCSGPDIVLDALEEEPQAFSQLYGGDNLVFPGEAGCANVRHEVVVVTSGNDPDVDGLVKVSWDQTVLVGPDPPAVPLTWTLTTAEYNAMPPPPGLPSVDIWMRSYTCSGAVTGEFCSLPVVAGGP